MSDLIEQIIAESKENVAARGHELKLENHASSLMIAGEATDFARIWRNLLSNAIKYTPDGGQIAVELGRLRLNPQAAATVSDIPIESMNLPADLKAGEYLIGQVKDTGRGMPPEDIDQLFTRFHRGWASQSNIPGTGLGLSLVQELLEFYDGGISVTSELGKGSCFSFWLPIDERKQK
jgi:signal transduction histidine kinase